jgi:hypothetical protein
MRQVTRRDFAISDLTQSLGRHILTIKMCGGIVASWTNRTPM